MQNSKAKNEIKIPLLGDIPVLGNLFKRTIKNDLQTELMIFLTPHIIQAPSELAALSAAETQRSDAPKAFDDKTLDKFLDSLPGRYSKPGKSGSSPSQTPK
jgi:type II secretory pathway component GspD/PulD (secretin)